eukprot:g30157.t1
MMSQLLYSKAWTMKARRAQEFQNFRHGRTVSNTGSEGHQLIGKVTLIGGSVAVEIGTGSSWLPCAVAMVLGSPGNNLHEVETAQGERFLASMPTKFRKNIWIKR